jgi:hypothetical protein
LDLLERAVTPAASRLRRLEVAERELKQAADTEYYAVLRQRGGPLLRSDAGARVVAL